MKTINLTTSRENTSKNNFTDYAISNEEMINIRGGEGDVIVKPSPPPIVP
jgi:hypothetical protein